MDQGIRTWGPLLGPIGAQALNFRGYARYKSEAGKRLYAHCAGHPPGRGIIQRQDPFFGGGGTFAVVRKERCNSE